MRGSELKGFTLIELLVVIAIIGILSSVVLASLGTARDKGRDAAIQSNLSTIQVQAELYYSVNGNYGASGPSGGGCGVSGYMFTDTATAVGNVIKKAIDATGSANGSGIGTSYMRCASSGTSYAVQSKLVGTSGYWCVDSSGNANKTAGFFNLAIPYTCPSS
jgi:prepilin-type N-terminal cleavage/methylation domain-containing protein